MKTGKIIGSAALKFPLLAKSIASPGLPLNQGEEKRYEAKLTTMFCPKCKEGKHLYQGTVPYRHRVLPVRYEDTGKWEAWLTGRSERRKIAIITPQDNF
jgi:hypothetical protein